MAEVLATPLDLAVPFDLPRLSDGEATAAVVIKAVDKSTAKRNRQGERRDIVPRALSFDLLFRSLLTASFLALAEPVAQLQLHVAFKASQGDDEGLAGLLAPLEPATNFDWPPPLGRLSHCSLFASIYPFLAAREALPDRESRLRQRRDWFDDPRIYEDISRRGLTSPYPNLVGPAVDALNPRDPASLLQWYTEARVTMFKRQAETAMLLRARPDDSARSVSNQEQFHLGNLERCAWDHLTSEFISIAPPVRLSSYF